jgi:hypothetical protein
MLVTQLGQEPDFNQDEDVEGQAAEKLKEWRDECGAHTLVRTRTPPRGVRPVAGGTRSTRSSRPRSSRSAPSSRSSSSRSRRPSRPT